MMGRVQHAYPVQIVALVTSPGHNYWFHSRDPRDGAGPHPTACPDAVEVVAGEGIVGDRFCGRVSRLVPRKRRGSPHEVGEVPSSAVSFVAAEALDEVAAELGLAAGALDPRLTRRNVVLRGADLNGLRHATFSLQPAGGAQVRFSAAGETSPCAWMDAVLVPGARDGLRGRGGLRATPTSSGRLAVGPAVLRSDAELDPSRAGDRVGRRARLP
jgi:hypothetical protein